MQIKKLKKIVAMSLSELLIALTVLGIVTAVAVPSLKHDADKSRIEGLFKKAYYDLSSAIDAEIADSPNLRVSNISWGMLTSRLNTIQLSVVQNDDGTYAKKTQTTGECMGASYRTFEGEAKGNVNDDNCVMLKSGISMKMLSCGETCTVMVDLNGPQQPNLYGYDAYEFTVSQAGVEPASAEASAIIANNWKINFW